MLAGLPANLQDWAGSIKGSAHLTDREKLREISPETVKPGQDATVFEHFASNARAGRLMRARATCNRGFGAALSGRTARSVQHRHLMCLQRARASARPQQPAAADRVANRLPSLPLH